MASYDQFGRVIRSAPAPQLDIPIRPSYSYSYNSYSTPWYQRFWYWLDNSISSIGNFIARNGESFANITVRIGIWIWPLGLFGGSSPIGLAMVFSGRFSMDLEQY